MVVKEKKNIANKVRQRFNKNHYSSNLIVVAHVRSDDDKYIFEGSTKWKLGMPDIRKQVKKLVSEKIFIYFNTYPDQINKLDFLF